MEKGYLIKIKRPNNNFYEYKCKFNGYTPNIKDALIYPPDSRDINMDIFVIRWLHPDWNAEIIDRIKEIGTYISTYNPKLTFKKILNNIGIALLIPIVIPIVAYLTAKDKIIELFNKKKFIPNNNKQKNISLIIT